jgi:hypothetical protein
MTSFGVCMFSHVTVMWGKALCVTVTGVITCAHFYWGESLDMSSIGRSPRV